MGCVFAIVVVSMLPHAEFGRNDHREDTPHFIERLWQFLAWENLPNSPSGNEKISPEVREARSCFFRQIIEVKPSKLSPDDSQFRISSSTLLDQIFSVRLEIWSDSFPSRSAIVTVLRTSITVELFPNDSTVNNVTDCFSWMAIIRQSSGQWLKNKISSSSLCGITYAA